MKFFGDGLSDDVSKTNWKRGDEIGLGAFGNVYKASLLSSDHAKVTALSVKSVRIPPYGRDEKKKRLQDEIVILAKLSNVRIIKYFGSCSTDSTIYIFMEFMNKGSLFSRIRSKTKLNELEAWKLAEQILQGVEYLHESRILHRDLKSENILMAQNGCIKIADFGVSKELKTISIANSHIGTVRYMAPEMFSSSDYSYPVDIWAVGCIVLEMLTGKLPFENLEEQQIGYYIMSNKKSPLDYQNEQLSISATQFLKVTFETDPRRRPSASYLLHNDPFIVGSENCQHFNYTRMLSNRMLHLNGFIPIDKYCATEKVAQLVELVECLTKLTVKLVVKSVSCHRPQSHKVSFAKLFGTGLITYCFSNNYGEGHIKIATDSMTVFDEIEAENTECILEYDHPDSNIIVLNEGEFLYRDNEDEVTELVFNFNNHEFDFYQDILQLRSNIKNLCTLKFDVPNFVSDKIIMISHPKGLSKHVSVGFLHEAGDNLNCKNLFGVRGAPIYQCTERVRYTREKGYHTDHNVFITSNLKYKNIKWKVFSS